jgi:hypothetical protein
MDTLRTFINRHTDAREWAQTVWPSLVLAILVTLDQSTRGPSLVAMLVQSYLA